MAKRRTTRRAAKAEGTGTTSAQADKRKVAEAGQIEDSPGGETVSTRTRSSRRRRVAGKGTTTTADRLPQEESGSDSGELPRAPSTRSPRRRTRRPTSKDLEQQLKEKKKKRGDDLSGATETIESSMTQLSSLLTMSQTQEFGGAFSQNISDEEIRDTLSASYLHGAKNNTQLAERFKRVSDVLRRCGQPENIPDDLPWQSDFPRALIERKLSINRKDPDIQIYAASCIADVLRINAPESPYTDRELKTVFDFLLRQLAGLKDGSTDRLFSQRFYLLERLATIKIFVLALNLDDSVDFVEHLFETLFDIVAGKESFQQKAEGYIADIMASLLESSDEITTRMVELLLEHLLSRTDKHDEQLVSYNIARAALEKTVDYMSQPIGDFINTEWENVQKHRGSASFKKRRARLFRIVYGLTLISTRLLLHVIPNIFSQLKDEEVETRSSIIQLLGSMFSAKQSTLARDYPALFEEYLGRFEDVEHRIRTYMSGFACKMLMNHHSTHHLIGIRLEQRIMDSDERVRRAVVDSVCEVATHFPHLITEELLKQVGERTRDKRPHLRMHTIQTLANLYRRHTEDIHKRIDSWNEEFLAKFAWIPGKIFSYYVEPQADADERLFVEKLIDENLLHQDVRTRTEALIDIWGRLNSIERASFARILLVKKKFQDTVRVLLGYNEKTHESSVAGYSQEGRGGQGGEVDEDMTVDSSQGDSDRGSDRSRGSVSQIIGTLSHMLPDQLTGKRVWRHVYKKRVNARSELIKVLMECVDEKHTYEQSCKLKERCEALERGETREVATYMTMVAQKCGMNLVAMDQIKAIFEQLESTMDKESERTSVILSFLETVSTIIPGIFVTSHPHIPALINSGEATILNAGLRILNATGRDLEDRDKVTAGVLRARLFELTHCGSVSQAKNAARCVSRVFSDREKELSSLLKSLLPKLRHGAQLPSVLAAMRIVALVAPDVYVPKSDRVVHFCFTKVLPGAFSDTDPSPRFGLPTTNCKSITQAIRLVSASLISRAKYGVSEELNELARRVASLLFSTLLYKGSIEKALNVIAETDDESSAVAGIGSDMDEQLFATDRARFRLAAAKGLVEILSYRESMSLLSMDLQQFQLLCFTMCDSSIDVRKSFAKTLKDALLSFKLPLKYAAALVIGVADDEIENAGTVRQFVTLVIRNYRDQHSRKGNSVQLSDYAAVHLYPEYILPYLIHLLAHHPDFENEFEHGTMLSFQRILFAYFDEACKDVDNVAFFHQMIYKLKQRKDRQDMQSTRIQTLCDLSISVLGSVTESRGSTHSFPGKIFIPGMFVSTASEEERDDDGSDGSGEVQRGDRMDMVRTLFLPPDFHLDEKRARDYRVAGPISPKRRSRQSGDTGSVSPGRRTQAAKKKRKRKGTAWERDEDSDTDESALSKSNVPIRRQPSRSARSKRAIYAEADEEDDEIEQDEEHEDIGEEDSDVELEEGQSGAEEEHEQEEEEEEVVIRPTRRKRRKKY